MARTASTRPLNTHEVRTKVPKSLMKLIEQEARSEGLRATDIVRRTLMARFQEPVTKKEGAAR